MGFSLTLSLVFMQFVSAADLNNVKIKAEPGENLILTCKDPDQGKITIAEWKRTDLESSEYVLLYKDYQLDPDAQHLSFRDRVDLLLNQLREGDVSLLLKNTTTEDSGTYECRIDTEKLVGKLISTISLQVSPPLTPPERFPVWATVLLVLLVLVLAAAAGVSFYFWLCWKPGPEHLEVEPGVEFVLLPFKVPRFLWFCKYRIFLPVDKVEWMDVSDRKVHVNVNGSDQPGDQDEFYRTRTKMDENLLKTGDLSLTLRRPTYEDSGTYICSVYNKKGNVLMEKDVWLKVKVPEQVEVESGMESVKLPWTITESLDGDVRVEWMDKYTRTVHVYQNGSDQPGDQHQFYKDRTKMDENLLKNKDLSLTLRRPTYEDGGTFTCRVSRGENVLMVKQVQLEVKAQDQVEVESGVESVLLSWTITEDLDGDTRVEWRDDRDRKVHVYQNGSDQPGEQHQRYRTRTNMDEKPLENKDLSLILRRPRERDSNIYICRVYRDGDVRMEKDIQLRVKAHQVEVESGVEFVELPCRTTESLDGDVRVEWTDGYNRTVHVYQDGSDQAGEQHPSYKGRTKIDENLLETKNLSLTLTPTRSNTFTCRVYRGGDVLMEKEVQLHVKAGTVQVQPDDNRKPLLADQSV